MDHAFPSLKTVLITPDAKEMAPALTPHLSKYGYVVVSTFLNDRQILRDVEMLKPQIVLIGIQHSLSQKMDIIRDIQSLRTTAIVILMPEWDPLLAKQAMDAGVAGYILQPFENAHIGATLETSWHHFQKLMALQEDLELRKLLTKTKGLLMKEQFMTEEEAHQTLLKMSQDQSIPLKKVCQSIVQLKAAMDEERLKKS